MGYLIRQSLSGPSKGCRQPLVIFISCRDRWLVRLEFRDRWLVVDNIAWLNRKCYFLRSSELIERFSVVNMFIWTVTNYLWLFIVVWLFLCRNLAMTNLLKRGQPCDAPVILVKHDSPCRPILVDHGRQWSTMVDRDRPIDRSQSITIDRSIDHGRPWSVNRSVGSGPGMAYYEGFAVSLVCPLCFST